MADTADSSLKGFAGSMGDVINTAMSTLKGTAEKLGDNPSVSDTMMLQVSVTGLSMVSEGAANILKTLCDSCKNSVQKF